MKELELKYGCNPNQKPARVFMKQGELPIEVLNGRPGYINLLDALNGWQLAPAYDLTKSSTSFGEQSTTVCGKGRDINDDDLRRLGDMFSLDKQRRNEIIRDVHAAVG